MSMPPAGTPTPSPAGIEAPRLNPVQRLIGVIISPAETFADIARKPDWLVPLVVYFVVFVSIMLLFSQRVGWRDFMIKQMSQNPNWEQLSDEQKEQQLSLATKIAPYTGTIGFLMGYIGIPALVGAIMMGALRAICAAEIRFSQAFSAYLYGMVPVGLVAGLLGIVVLFLKDPADVDLENLLGSNVGAYLSSETPKWLKSLCDSLDIFVFWTLFLMGVGYSAIHPRKVKFGTAFGLIFGLWLVYVLAKTGLAAVFS